MVSAGGHGPADTGSLGFPKGKTSLQTLIKKKNNKKNQEQRELKNKQKEQIKLLWDV